MSKIRFNDVMFYAGGECYQKFGLPVMGFSRAQRVAPTFTRSGAVGPFTGRDGVLRSGAADRLRVEWLDLDDDGIFETPALLLEAARTNLIDSDDISAWSVVETPTITGSISDPAGGTGAYTVADDGGGTWEYPFRNVTLTGGAGLTRCVVFVVRENTMPVNGHALNFGTAADIRGQLLITAWTAGEPTVVAGSAGSYLGKRFVGNGYWALYLQTNASVSSAETNRAEIRAAYASDETGSIDVYRVNAYDVAVPGWSILDASEARSADSWYASFAHVPQAMTLYVKFIEAGFPNWVTEGATQARVLQIGAAANSDPRLFIFRPSTAATYRLTHSNGVVTGVNDTVTLSPTWGDVIELRAVLNADGSVELGGSKNSAAEVTGTPSAAHATQAAWSDTRLWLGAVGSLGPSLSLMLAVKAVAGVRTMDEMRDLFAWSAAA